MRNTLITRRARELRKSMSSAEVLRWTRLRGRGPDKPTFRRQHPFETIILDFYCPSARLAVEVDGRTHWDDDARAKDEARDAWLRRQGVTTLRIPAGQVYRDIVGTTEAILALAAALIAEQRSACGFAPSTTRSPAGGPPPAVAAQRGR